MQIAKFDRLRGQMIFVRHFTDQKVQSTDRKDADLYA